VAFPPVTRPAQVYGVPVALEYPLTRITQRSRFVLYDDGGFVLQFVNDNGSVFEYAGTYRQVAANTIAFAFSADPSDAAVGTLQDRALTIRYDLHMRMADFEDALYTLTE
jgi:hypothetical protein